MFEVAVLTQVEQHHRDDARVGSDQEDGGAEFSNRGYEHKIQEPRDPSSSTARPPAPGPRCGFRRVSGLHLPSRDGSRAGPRGSSRRRSAGTGWCRPEPGSRRFRERKRWRCIRCIEPDGEHDAGNHERCHAQEGKGAAHGNEATADDVGYSQSETTDTEAAEPAYKKLFRIVCCELWCSNSR